MINYPNKKNNLNQNKKIDSSNRGMSLEKDLDSTNKFYLSSNRANIHKKPTPIQIVKVDYPNRQSAKITEAYFKLPSTTDYNGVYRGHYVDFEAKETKNKTKFIYANIHKHQINHLESVINHGGIAFFIIKFITLNEVYVLSAQIVINSIKSGNKSLGYDIISSIGYLIKQGYNPRIDYLDAIDKIIDSR